MPRLTGAIALIVGVITSCTQYTVGDQAFRSKEEALAAHQHQLVVTLAAISRTQEPVGGSVRIVLPTRERIAATGLTTQGSPSEEVIDYLVTTQFRDFETMAYAVEKRVIFDRVDIEHSDEMEKPEAGGHDFVLWFYQPAPTAFQWFLRDASTDAAREIPLDQSKTAGPDRVRAWLGAIERAARKMWSTSHPSTTVHQP